MKRSFPYILGLLLSTLASEGCFYEYLCTGDDDCGPTSYCTNQGTCEPVPLQCTTALDCVMPPQGTLSCFDAACMEGECTYRAAVGRPCGEVGCAGGQQWDAPTCSVTGVCEPPKTTACHPYTCSGAACAVACDDETQCVPGYLCNDGTCEDPQCQGAAAGTPCGDPSDSPCDHPDSCNGTGLCLPNFELPDIPCGSGDDAVCDRPDVCDGQGACSANLAPQGTPCGDANPGTCDAPDSCDGLGTCASNLLVGTCAPGDECIEDTQCSTSHCNGGLCCSEGTCCTDDSPCGGYLCETASFTCKAQCSDDTQCTAGYHCETQSCELDFDDDAPCTRDAQCGSGACSEGVCGPGACFLNTEWQLQAICDNLGNSLGSQPVLGVDGCKTYCNGLGNAVCCHMIQLGDAKSCLAFGEATGLRAVTGTKAVAAAYCGPTSL